MPDSSTVDVAAQGSRAGVRETAAVALVVLWGIVLFAAWLTYSASHARVVVRWLPRVGDSERLRLEREFHLFDGEGKPDGEWNYRLADRSPGNLRRIVQHPGIAGTGHIDREALQLVVDAPGWPHWMIAAAARHDLGTLTLALTAVALVLTWPVHRRAILSTTRASSVAGRICEWTLGIAFLTVIVINGLQLQVREYALNQPRIDSWQVTELLINYSGGPIRRGLLGEIIRIANQAQHPVNVHWVVVSMSAIGWLIACALLWRQTRPADVITRAALLFSPVLLGFPLNDVDAFGRKDSLSVAFVGLALMTLWMSDARGRRAFVLLTVFGLPAVIATHEAALFFCVPASMAIGLAHSMTAVGSPAQRGLRLALWLTPAAAVAAFAALHRGDPSQVIEVCGAAAAQYPGIPCAPPTRAMSSLLPATQAAYAAVIHEAWRSPMLYRSLAGTLAYLWCLMIAVRTVIEAGRSETANARDLYVTAGCLLLPTIPLYVLGADYGRWLSTSAVIAVMVLTNARAAAAPLACLRRRPARTVRSGPTARTFLLERLLLVSTVLAAPFLYLAHYPPSFVVTRAISGRSFNVGDFVDTVARVWSQ